MPLLYLFEHSFEIKGSELFLVMGAQNLASLFPGEHSTPRNCLMQNKQLLQQEAATNTSASQQKLLLTITLSQLLLLTLFLASQISGA